MCWATNLGTAASKVFLHPGSLLWISLPTLSLAHVYSYFHCESGIVLLDKCCNSSVCMYIRRQAFTNGTKYGESSQRYIESEYTYYAGGKNTEWNAHWQIKYQLTGLLMKLRVPYVLRIMYRERGSCGKLGDSMYTNTFGSESLFSLVAQKAVSNQCGIARYDKPPTALTRNKK
jgi:hypothetical protein